MTNRRFLEYLAAALILTVALFVLLLVSGLWGARPAGEEADEYFLITSPAAGGNATVAETPALE